ncbi:MAG: hypothetical protein ACRC2S_09570 [Waterburya sp.]
MEQNCWRTKPNSFAETVQLVEDYVRAEIAQETKDKQLYYHTLDHALAVKRRANLIFQGIKPVLQASQSLEELQRLESLIALCAVAHDMVQEFVVKTETYKPRQRIPGVSETATANKLIQYLRDLNQNLATDVKPTILFSDKDLKIIEDAIAATICARDPLAGKVSYSFSPYSIYQPYLYTSQTKISLVGNVIALADLGTLGIEGIKPYLQEGILVFIEDNLDLADLILSCSYNYSPDLNSDLIKARLLNMARFMVSLAQERRARFELEIASFPPSARQILREQIFVYLNAENIKKIETIVPTKESTSLSELMDFFCLNTNKNVVSSKRKYN